MLRLRLFFFAFACCHLAATTISHADEGMWLFNAPPAKQLREKYQFEASPQWLERLQKSSVRFNSGGSGSFVSSTGLVITNHHVGFDVLAELGDAKSNYVRDGFVAQKQSEEKKAPDLELNVLMSIEDVTSRVNSAVKTGLAPDAAKAARQAAIAAIEKESKEKTGLRSDVVTLHQGGAYHLYRYKRYDDVRLVFAPEHQIASFGGDPDNFEYPRYSLDICLFRVYENERPAQIEHFLKWNPRGAQENDLVFVSGHPGSTNRQWTLAELRDLRDQTLPAFMELFFRKDAVLTAWAARSKENERKAEDDLASVRNNRKRYEGYLAALHDPAVMRELEGRERKLRSALPRKSASEAEGPYERIQAAQAEIAKNARVHSFFEVTRSRGPSYRAARGFPGNLFKYARLLLRAGDERVRPDSERLPEFRESAKESMELEIFSTEPVYEDYERFLLTDAFVDLATNFGFDDPVTQTVLKGKSPHERAAEVVAGTKLKDVGLRRKLYEGGAAAISAAADPMLELARAVDKIARDTRSKQEAQEEVKRQAHAEIAAARFQQDGGHSAPDATFTLRLSFGTVIGYEESGTKIPASTRTGGLYERAAEHDSKPPFDLPARWVESKARLAMETQFNFVSTADTIGGSSGSPAVNRTGEFVGIIFDGNIQSLGADVLYTEKQARTVSVSSAIIDEALRKVYGATKLADELNAGGSTPPAPRAR